MGTSQQVVISWWGPSLIPEGHLLGQEYNIDSIVCQPEQEDTLTMVTTMQSTGWMKLFLNLHPKLVCDVYSISG